MDYTGGRNCNLLEYCSNVYNDLWSMGVSIPEVMAKKLDATKFQDLVNDDIQCLRIINAALETEDLLDIGYVKNINRASHIIITWLLGIGLGDYFGLNKMRPDFAKIYKGDIWLQTAILHDYGYFIGELGKDNLTIKDITSPYNLLEDTYSNELFSCLNGMEDGWGREFFSYSYDEIRRYFDYAKDFHSDPNNQKMGERNDHGIVGGCTAFKKYCSKVENDSKKGLNPSPGITKIQKVACLTASMHNIFKSSSEDDDKKYQKYGLTRLLSTNPQKTIKTKNTLLTLLSLVDTVECTKRFSAKADSKSFLWQQTTLKNVELRKDDSKSMIFDFNKLEKHIKNGKRNPKEENVIGEAIHDKEVKLKSHISALLDIGNWTDFEAEAVDDYAVKIKLKGRIPSQYK